MATKLTYPKLPYVRLGLWTLKNKIFYETGYHAVTWGSGENIHFDFTEDLTQDQIDWITALMQRSDAQGPDTDLIIVNNTYVMYDLWERRDLIAAECGFDFRIWWDSSGDLGADVMDKIIFTPIGPGGSVRILTVPQKNALIAAITSGDGWE